MRTKIQTLWKGVILGMIPVVLTYLILMVFFQSCEKDPFDETSGNFTDTRDNHPYKWVKIGDQIWMAENLAFLPSVSPPSAESNSEPYYYVYGYGGTDVSAAKNTANYSTYGVLYNWPAAMNGATGSNTNPSGIQGVCPVGWHLPSDAEWTVLSDYLTNNGYGYEGSGDDIAKSLASTTNWYNYSNPGTPGNDPANNNKSGFSGLPGGDRRDDDGGCFYGIGNGSLLWSSTEYSSTNAVYRILGNCCLTFVRGAMDKYVGCSIRCVRN
jgi:uncharacterized protein (TIGR02145 family)